MHYGNNLDFIDAFAEDHEVGETTETLEPGAMTVRRALLRGRNDSRHGTV